MFAPTITQFVFEHRTPVVTIWPLLRFIPVRSPVRRLLEVLLLVLVTSSLWFCLSYASPCRTLPAPVSCLCLQLTRLGEYPEPGFTLITAAPIWMHIISPRYITRGLPRQTFSETLPMHASDGVYSD